MSIFLYVTILKAVFVPEKELFLPLNSLGRTLIKQWKIATLRSQ